MTFMGMLLSMEIELTIQAEEDLEDLPVTMFDRYEKVLDRLERYPEVSGIKWLTGDWRGHGRIRFGDYRLIFHMEAQQQRIVVDRVAHRKNVYIE
jgi:mRNA interferase RelE/StbE